MSASRPTKGSAGRRSRSAARILFHLAVVAAIIGLAVVYIDFEQLVASLMAVRLDTIVIVILLVTASRLLMSFKWLLLLRAVGVDPPFGKIVSLYYQAAFLSRITPTAISGETLRGYLMSRYANRWDVIVGSMLVERITAVLAILILSTLSSFVLIEELAASNASYLQSAMAILFVVGAALFALSLSDRHTHKLERLVPTKRGKSLFAKLHQAYTKYRYRKSALAKSTLLSLLESAIQVLIVFSVAVGLDTDAPALTLIAAITISQFLQRAVFLLEGWALGEFVLVLVCSLAGIDQTEALAFSLVSSAIRLIAISPGGIFLVMNKREKEGTGDKKASSPRTS